MPDLPRPGLRILKFPLSPPTATTVHSWGSEDSFTIFYDRILELLKCLPDDCKARIALTVHRRRLAAGFLKEIKDAASGLAGANRAREDPAERS